MKRAGKRAVGGTTGTKRVIAYCRVSTERQATEGASLDAQKAMLAAYATAYGLEIVETIVDAGESAKTLHRPGVARALALLAVGAADGLVVTKLDRLTRSLRDLNDLLAGPFAPGKAALLSVGEHLDTSSAAGRLLINILTSVAQWEREAIGERTAAVKARQREVGTFTGGGAPFGWKVGEGGKLEPVASEQETIRRAVELDAEAAGHLSLAKIARVLADEGRFARNGGRFHAQQIANMLARVERPEVAA